MGSRRCCCESEPVDFPLGAVCTCALEKEWRCIQNTNAPGCTYRWVDSEIGTVSWPSVKCFNIRGGSVTGRVLSHAFAIRTPGLDGSASSNDIIIRCFLVNTPDGSTHPCTNGIYWFAGTTDCVNVLPPTAPCTFCSLLFADWRVSPGVDCELALLAGYRAMQCKAAQSRDDDSVWFFWFVKQASKCKNEPHSPGPPAELSQTEIILNPVTVSRRGFITNTISRGGACKDGFEPPGPIVITSYNRSF